LLIARDCELNPTVPERPPPLPQAVAELWDLLVAYFKQETAVPLQQLLRVVAFGLLSALLLGFGVICVTVGGLRLLQEETGETFTGDWSWAPYGIMTVALLLVGGVIWKVGTRRKHRKPAAA
jgi:Putative Actinobacterial Holin-X, holin superfamily III